MSIAFKEWAIICDALGRGDQSIILRKGGIHEGRDGFSFKHPEFFLFPTLFHEQVAKTRLPAGTPIPPGEAPGRIAIQYFARMEWSAVVTDLDRALALSPFHLWSDQVVRERFQYDEAPGVHVAFLRVHRCEPGWSFPDEPKYGGCRSWVEVPDAPAGLQLNPVLADADHAERSRQIKAALG